MKSRKTRKTIAVIGEGPTEWHYVNDFRVSERVKVTLRPSLPKSSNYRDIFKKAVQMIDGGYDKVCCLLDLDVCMRNQEELEKYQSIKRKTLSKGNIVIYETMPCIEFWFLLHFKNYSNKAYTECKEVLRELKQYLPDYEKSNDFRKKVKIYNYLSNKGDLEKAKKNAARLEYEKEKSDNLLFPFSEIPKFIDDMIKE